MLYALENLLAEALDEALPEGVKVTPGSGVAAAELGFSFNQYPNHCRRRLRRSTSSHGSPVRERS